MAFVKNIITILTVLIVGLCVSQSAVAGNWRFKRSYFTHELPREYQPHFPTPPSRSAYRPAYISPYPGFSLQGGFRINRIQINSGTSSDTVINYGGWLQAR